MLEMGGNKDLLTYNNTINPYQQIVDMPIVGNKTIVDLLFYENYSYWWAIDFKLYRVIISKDAFNYNKLSRFIFRLSEYISLPILGSDIANYLIGHILSLDTPIKKNEQINGSVVYLLNYIQWREDNNDNNYVFKNIYNGNIIDNLPTSIQLLTQYEELNITSLLKYHSLHKKILFHDKQHNPYSCWKYWSYDVWKKQKKASRYFKDVWSELSKHDEWFAAWASQMHTSIDTVKRYMRLQINISIPVAIGYSAIIENIMETKEPIVMVLTNEQMVNGRGLVHASRKHGVKTIGIQHGTIANHAAYLYHDPSDVSVSGKEIGKSFPVPDITCVWGDAEYNLLVNGAGYPANQVIVTGNPRYDYLGHASEMFSRTEFCKRYNINPGNKIILWATQSHGWSMDENNLYFEEVFETCKNIYGITLIIKQHPNEGSAYRDLIEKYISKYNLNMQIIVPDKMSNTTEMVYVSDVVINKSSTTGQEAVAFHKPIIIMDFSKTKKPDAGEYVKEGVAIPAFSRGSLKPALYKIINDGCNLEEAQDAYIKNHFYKIDGLASKRVADIITKIAGA